MRRSFFIVLRPPWRNPFENKKRKIAQLLFHNSNIDSLCFFFQKCLLTKSPGIFRLEITSNEVFVLENHVSALLSLPIYEQSAAQNFAVDDDEGRHGLLSATRDPSGRALVDLDQTRWQFFQVTIVPVRHDSGSVHVPTCLFSWG